MDKFYVSYNMVHKLIKKLAERITYSGFDPDVIVAIGSGGFIPARIIKTFINRPIYAVGISYYGMDHKHREHPTKIFSSMRSMIQEQLSDTVSVSFFHMSRRKSQSLFFTTSLRRRMWSFLQR